MPFEQVWKSDDELYGRHITVDRVTGVCMICNEKGLVLSVDTSDDEYLRFVCCAPCFLKLVVGDAERSRT